VDGQGGNRKGKRERSKTGQAPTAEQRQEWQVSSSDLWTGGNVRVRCVLLLTPSSLYRHLASGTYNLSS
jgi:hypothetical protein